MQNHEGLRYMQAEMARQCSDALATFSDVQPEAAKAAKSARATGELTLCAMGGSHHVNAIAAPLYRKCGLDARAWVASELLSSPLPDKKRTVLIASQSGRSGEIIQYLAHPAGSAQRFALTLDGKSPLAEGCASALVAHGGLEQAFAATRSITLTIAMHGAILEALGVPQQNLRDVFEADLQPDISAVDTALDGTDAVVFTGYGVMSGVAASAALSMMELARVPTIGFEAGQFRHGPFEMLRPGLGIVLLRDGGEEDSALATIAAATVEAGCKTIVVDTSGQPALKGCTTLSLRPNHELAAAASMLLALQHVNIAVARRRIPVAIGTPLRTSKVTT